MKVTLEKDYRKYYTLEDLDHAKTVIECEKGDDFTPKDWAVYAANEAMNHHAKFLYRFEDSDIIQASARTAKNCRVWNQYGDTADMDVWIDFTAFSGNYFIVGGGYISDINKHGSEDYGEHLYYRVFEEVK